MSDEREESWDEYQARRDEHEWDELQRNNDSLRARIAELERSLKYHREDLDLRVAELRLWLKRHEVAEPALAEFWAIVANKRPRCGISDVNDPNDLGLGLAQRNERQSARIAELEKELARYDCSAADARICKQQMIEQRARAEKAEAERDEFKRLHRHALDSVDQVFQSCDEVPHPLLPDFCRVGEDKFRAVVRLANRYISIRAERDRYLAAINRWNTAKRQLDWREIEASESALRRIAEEKTKA